MSANIEQSLGCQEPTLSLESLDQGTSLSDLLGLTSRKDSSNSVSMNPVKTLQCGEFKYPDVSSPLGKILSSKFDDYYGSPQRRNNSEFGPILGGLSMSPYNPNFDEVFLMTSTTSRSPTETSSPFRPAFRLMPEGLETGGQRSYSPESDVGYGTSYGSQEFGQNLDMDSFCNLMRTLSLNSSSGPRFSSTDNFVTAAEKAEIQQSLDNINASPEKRRIGLAELDPFYQSSPPSPQPPNRGETQLDLSEFFLPPIRSKSSNTNGDGLTLEKAAKLHRNSAAYYDATCTWRGSLPPRSHNNKTLSVKVFLGGVPWDITDVSLMQAFRPFGNIRIEWPGKDNGNSCAGSPKGYLYVIFEHEKQVRNLLSACTQDFGSGGGSWYFKISSRRMRNKEVQVIPWVIGDSAFVRCPSARLDSNKTVFVGALHGMLSAEGLANIFQDLFQGVVYSGIDTDKYKYPIGSGRVVFNNTRSYMKAVSAAFIEIKTAKFTKKIQVDPYLEDAICSHCNLRQGPYYCRDLLCFKYFCRSCWDAEHTNYPHHKPIMRNSRKDQQMKKFVSLPAMYENL